MEKTWRYASRRLNGSVVHIAGQIKTELKPEVVEKVQSKTFSSLYKKKPVYYIYGKLWGHFSSARVSTLLFSLNLVLFL